MHDKRLNQHTFVIKFLSSGHSYNSVTMHGKSSISGHLAIGDGKTIAKCYFHMKDLIIVMTYLKSLFKGGFTNEMACHAQH